MSLHDYIIDNSDGLTVRNDINSALAAIVSNNSFATAPTTTTPFMFWADTTSGLLKMRNAADNDWVNKGLLAAIQSDNNIYDAHSIIIAISDNTPVVLPVAASGMVGRGSSGNIVSLTPAQVEAILLDRGVTINESGADVDLRIESLNQDNKLFINAGEDRLQTRPGSASSGFANIGGTLSMNTTEVGTDANTSEKTLMSYTLPANTLLNDGEGIFIEAWGVAAVPVVTNTIRLRWGGLEISTLGPVLSAAGMWYLKSNIFRTGSAAQDIMPFVNFLANNFAPQSFLTDTENLAVGILIELTGQNGGTPAANDIICHGLKVEFLG